MFYYTGKASILIVGAGGLGLWCLQNAKALLPSCTRIVVADIAVRKSVETIVSSIYQKYCICSTRKILN